LNTNAKQEAVPLREDDDSGVRTFQKSCRIHDQMRQFTAIRFNFTLQLNLLRLLDIRHLYAHCTRAIEERGFVCE